MQAMVPLGTPPRRGGLPLRFALLLLLGGAATTIGIGFAAPAHAAEALDVVINEIAWQGTQHSGFDEWIELHNNTDEDIDITTWSIVGGNTGDGVVNLAKARVLTSTIIPAGGYLVYANGEGDIADGSGNSLVDLWDHAISFRDPGETLILCDAPNGTGNVIDTVNGDGGGWPGRVEGPAAWTIERIDPLTVGIDANWAINNGWHRNGFAATLDPLPINGTPGARNSVNYPSPPPADFGDVVINEVAWMGTVANYRHEWIELRNTTDRPICVADWSILGGGSLGSYVNIVNSAIRTTPVIPAGGYLILADGESSVRDGSGNSLVDVYNSGLSLVNTGEPLSLHDYRNAGGSVIDIVNGDGGAWPAGDNSAPKLTMERIDSSAEGTDDNWASNDGIQRSGFDAAGNPINGTPGDGNSVEQARGPLRGDINQDGEVDVCDACMCLRAARGFLSLTPEQAVLADVDEDGDVDPADATLLAEYVIGLHWSLP